MAAGDPTGGLSSLSPATAGIMAGGSLLGTTLGAIGGTQQQNKSLGEQKREFNLSNQLQQQSQANSLGRQQQMAPLRDQVIAQLMNRSGMSPTQFNPLNYGSGQNQGAPSQGGIDLNALAQKNNASMPNAGQNGAQMSAMNNAMLAQLGYGSPQQLQHQANSGDLGAGYNVNLGLQGSGGGSQNMGQQWTPQQGYQQAPQQPPMQTGSLGAAQLYKQGFQSPNGMQSVSGMGQGAYGNQPMTGQSPYYNNSLQSF